MGEVEAEAEAKPNSSHVNWAEELRRSLSFSRSLPHLNSSSNLQDYVAQAVTQYRVYEDAFFKKAKEELLSVKEHPTMAIGVAVSSGLLLMRGMSQTPRVWGTGWIIPFKWNHGSVDFKVRRCPRRFLFRHTLGRFQSEEAQFLRAEKNVKELNFSVDLMKKESGKLLERATLAEKDMKHGQTELMSSGSQIQNLAKSVYKAETQAADLMDGLREIPGREALKLRAEVASMASLLKRQRIGLDKRIMKISELGIPV